MKPTLITLMFITLVFSTREVEVEVREVEVDYRLKNKSPIFIGHMLQLGTRKYETSESSVCV